MMITAKTVHLLKNKLFCTKEEAVEIAKSMSSDDSLDKVLQTLAWKMILLRDDVSVDEALKIAVDLNNLIHWSIILDERKDFCEYLLKLEINEALLLLKKIKADKAFELILERPDVIKFFAVELGILDAVGKGREFENWMIWQLILKRSDIPFLHAIDYAKEISNWKVWITVLTREDIEPALALRWAEKIGDSDVMKAVLEREDVKKYLADLNPSRAVRSIGKFTGYEFWGDFVSRTDVPMWTALKYAEKLFNVAVYSRIFDREDIPLEKRLNVAFEIENHLLWRYLAANENIKHNVILPYIEKVNVTSVWAAFILRKDIIFEYAVGFVNTIDLWITVLSREDATPEIVLPTVTGINDPDIWEQVLSNRRMVNYIYEVLSTDDIIRLSATVKDWRFVRIAVLREDIKPKLAILLLKDTLEEEAWKALFSRSDVRVYLSLMSGSGLISLVKEINNPRFLSYVVDQFGYLECFK